MRRHSVFISTVPFAYQDRSPLEMMEGQDIDFLINPVGRKLTERELGEQIVGHDVLIAGTEPITARVMEQAPNLKLISRVGIGLDNVDLLCARKRGIQVSYTPEAPAEAVADLTVGLMINLARQIMVSNDELHKAKWHRYLGRRLGEMKVGIVGVGRIGRRVLSRLAGFGCFPVLANDINPDRELDSIYEIEWLGKKDLYRRADVISLHVPLTKYTKNMVGRPEFQMMKPDVLLINTARGGIVNEKDLYTALRNDQLLGAALDVFSQEPYTGPLIELSNCLMTAHMGSMSVDCRTRMEIEATEDAIRFLSGKNLLREVPEVEYQYQNLLGVR